jgi:hypothetical protein
MSCSRAGRAHDQVGPVRERRAGKECGGPCRCCVAAAPVQRVRPGRCAGAQNPRERITLSRVMRHAWVTRRGAWPLRTVREMVAAGLSPAAGGGGDLPPAGAGSALARTPPGSPTAAALPDMLATINVLDVPRQARRAATAAFLRVTHPLLEGGRVTLRSSLSVWSHSVTMQLMHAHTRVVILSGASGAVGSSLIGLSLSGAWLAHARYSARPGPMQGSPCTTSPGRKRGGRAACHAQDRLLGPPPSHSTQPYTPQHAHPRRTAGAAPRAGPPAGGAAARPGGARIRGRRVPGGAHTLFCIP